MSNQTEIIRNYHRYAEFSLLVKTVLQPHKDFKRTMLNVDKEGQVYFIDKDNVRQYILPKHRDRFLDETKGVFDYHFQVR